MAACSKRKIAFASAALLALVSCAIPLIRHESMMASSRDLPSRREMDRIVMIADALRWLGTPYAYGSDGPRAMDCSGFVHRVVVDSGSLPEAETPRKSTDFALLGRSVDGSIRPGDILLFEYRGRVDHVAIALSSDSFINAVSQGPRRGVVISSFEEDCWRDSFAGARRIGREEKK